MSQLPPFFQISAQKDSQIPSPTIIPYTLSLPIFKKKPVSISKIRVYISSIDHCLFIEYKLRAGI